MPGFGGAFDAAPALRERGTGDREVAERSKVWALLAKQMCEPSLSWFRNADTDGNGHSALPEDRLLQGTDQNAARDFAASRTSTLAPQSTAWSSERP